MQKFSTILFDFDGVLGKSVEDNYRAWSYALSKQGIEIEAEEYYLLEGHRSPDVATKILTTHNCSLNVIDTIVKDKDDHYIQHNRFAFYEGSGEVVDWARSKGFKIGVVSGGSKRRLMSTAAKELLDHLDVVVTADDCTQGKPQPEPYLKAAKSLGISPASCVVIENAPLGIQAAKNAEMVCIAICSTLDRKHLSQADYIVDSLKDVPALLESIS
ncbi:MAG: HAD family phosphatase [Deltaproteobacteria bacterium]|nr:HAD family phosphatase [Deltaproteobacteria bacterium]